jgi:hypothetical protein
MSGSLAEALHANGPPHLRSLRDLLEALGVEVPDGPLDIDLTELVDLIVGGLVHKGQITDFWWVEYGDDDPEKMSETSNVIPFRRYA